MVAGFIVFVGALVAAAAAVRAAVFLDERGELEHLGDDVARKWDAALRL